MKSLIAVIALLLIVFAQSQKDWIIVDDTPVPAKAPKENNIRKEIEVVKVPEVKVQEVKGVEARKIPTEIQFQETEGAAPIPMPPPDFNRNPFQHDENQSDRPHKRGEAKFDERPRKGKHHKERNEAMKAKHGKAAAFPHKEDDGEDELNVPFGKIGLIFGLAAVSFCLVKLCIKKSKKCKKMRQLRQAQMMQNIPRSQQIPSQPSQNSMIEQEINYHKEQLDKLSAMKREQEAMRHQQEMMRQQQFQQQEAMRQQQMRQQMMNQQYYQPHHQIPVGQPIYQPGNYVQGYPQI